MAEEWDWELQQAQTAYTVSELLKEGVKEGAMITLDFSFKAGEGADRTALEKALVMFGYELGDEDGEFTASISDIPFTLDSIWTHEERTTKMALARGFEPDGWGFWEPEK